MRPEEVYRAIALLGAVLDILTILDNEGFSLTNEIVSLEEMQDNLSREYPRGRIAP